MCPSNNLKKLFSKISKIQTKQKHKVGELFFVQGPNGEYGSDDGNTGGQAQFHAKGTYPTILTIKEWVKTSWTYSNKLYDLEKTAKKGKLPIYKVKKCPNF